MSDLLKNLVFRNEKWRGFLNISKTLVTSVSCPFFTLYEKERARGFTCKQHEKVNEKIDKKVRVLQEVKSS